MFQGLLPLIILAVIVYRIVMAFRRHGDFLADRGGSAATLKRLFIYAMLFASLIVASIGLTGIIGTLISSAAARRAADLASPLALTIVGVPVVVLLAMWIWRTHIAEPAELAGAAWALYLNAALLTTLGVAIGYAFAVADRAVEGEWPATAVAGLVVWSGAWVVHWLTWRRFPPAIMPRAHLWFASGAGLWIGAGSIGFVIDNVVRRAIGTDAAAALSPTTRDLKLAACGVAIGAAVWVWHWLVHGANAPRTEGWYGYVLLFGVLAGLAAAVVGAGLGIYRVLEWWLGDPDAITARSHFRELSSALSVGLVGLGSWRYHRSVVGPSATRERTETDRIYDYLVSGVALVTVGVAIVILVLAFFDAIAPASAAGAGDSTTNTLLAAVTALIVGVPMWAATWLRIQRLTAAHPEEVAASTRRTYLFGIFGVGGAIAFGALITLLAVIFRAILNERTGGAIATEIDMSVALLVTTGSAALYHWMVYRTERHVTARPSRRDVLLVGDGAIDADQIASRTHTRVRALHRLDLPAGTAIDIEAVVAEIDHAEGAHLLVVTGADEIQVIPLE